MPNTIRAKRPSGTVRGSGIMKREKISSSGEVTRIVQSGTPQIGVRCQLATIQWSGSGASPMATKAAKAAMKATSISSSFNRQAITRPPPIRTA